ncbi:helix-turn-helix domain-containing protein [Neptuniibacter marinus]|uniref:helix-turn-helix domain-containing protein n=1 Tax=Neptuniibacter marinus TaxID=1806670 RepID=UPI00083316FA|nr:helix-turn-helix transcriptional regulator [Neptuniibacter marinus]
MERLQYENIFEAINDDQADAADLAFRADLMLVIRKIIKQKSWKQAEAAAALSIPQPRVSDLLCGKVDKFSSDALIGFLARLGFRFNLQYQSERQKPLQVKVRQEAA